MLCSSVWRLSARTLIRIPGHFPASSQIGTLHNSTRNFHSQSTPAALPSSPPKSIPPYHSLGFWFPIQVVFCSLPTRSAARCVRWIWTSARFAVWVSVLELPLPETNSKHSTWKGTIWKGKFIDPNHTCSEPNLLLVSERKKNVSWVAGKLYCPKHKQYCTSASPAISSSDCIDYGLLVGDGHTIILRMTRMKERLVNEWHMKGRMIIPTWRADNHDSVDTACPRKLSEDFEKRTF